MNNKSTGPRTDEGKARSSQNALKTGMYSESMLIPGEKREDFEQLSSEYYERHLPDTPEARDQLDTVITCVWLLRRYAVVQSQLWAYKIQDLYHPKEGLEVAQAFLALDTRFTRLQRIVTATQRNRDIALKELERLRKLDPEPRVEPQPDPAPAPQPEENKSVPKPGQFVPSTSVPPPAPAANNPVPKPPAGPPRGFSTPERPKIEPERLF